VSFNVPKEMFTCGTFLFSPPFYVLSSFLEFLLLTKLAIIFDLKYFELICFIIQQKVELCNNYLLISKLFHRKIRQKAETDLT